MPLERVAGTIPDYPDNPIMERVMAEESSGQFENFPPSWLFPIGFRDVRPGSHLGRLTEFWIVEACVNQSTDKVIIRDNIREYTSLPK